MGARHGGADAFDLEFAGGYLPGGFAVLVRAADLLTTVRAQPPALDDEFTCSSCFLVHSRVLLADAKPSIGRDCA